MAAVPNTDTRPFVTPEGEATSRRVTPVVIDGEGKPFSKGDEHATAVAVVSDLGLVEIIRVDVGSRRLVVRDSEGRVFARKINRCKIVRNFGKIVKAGSKTAQKIQADLAKIDIDVTVDA